MKVSRFLPLSLIGLMAWGVLGGWTTLALAQSATGILVDASGSMQGFFATGTIYDLYRKIDGAIEEQKYPFYFKHRRSDGVIQGGLAPYTEPARADGSTTLIERGYEDLLQRHPTLGAVWLVTDNVQDPQGNLQEQGDIEQFYTKLRQPGAKRVHIFPTTMAFNGLIYGRDGNTRVGTYSGQRGVIIYAILLNEKQEAAFRNSLQRFVAILGERGILAKPLDATAPDGTTKVIEQQLVLPQPNEPLPPNRLAVLKNSEGKDELALPQRIFPSGQRIEGEFLVRFRSRLDNVTITSGPEVMVAVDQPFRLAGSPPAMPKVGSQPLTLQYDLLPGGISSDVKVRVIFPEGISLTQNDGCIWTSSQPGHYTGSVEVGLRVKKKHLSLAHEIRTKYGTKDPAYFTSLSPTYQTRIFGLEDLFRESSPEVFETSRTTYQVAFNVACPVPPDVWGGLSCSLSSWSPWD